MFSAREVREEKLDFHQNQMDTGLSEGSDKQIKIRVTLLFENDTLYFKDIFLCKEN